jgi:hypothetical protein
LAKVQFKTLNKRNIDQAKGSLDESFVRKNVKEMKCALDKMFVRRRIFICKTFVTPNIAKSKCSSGEKNAIQKIH